MSDGRLKTDLRISGGTLRGRRVPIPRGDVRPTSERARQAYFNIVGERIVDARFLDLFAGSGIFSFEAMSRGAASALAVDSSRHNLAQIAKLAETFGVKVETIPAVIPSEARNLGGRGAFDLAYADPPYDFEHYDDLIRLLDTIDFSEEATVAVEHRRHTTPFTVEPQRLAFWRRAEYGEVWITFFTAGKAPRLQ